MENNQIFDLLIEHILSVYDENDDEIIYNDITYKIEKRPHSSVKSVVIYIDGKSLTRDQTRSYKVMYLCRCGRKHKILLQKYLLKKKLYCINCVQDRSYDDHIIANKIGKNKIQKPIKKEFDEYDDEFKYNYSKNHLSNQEFYKYLPHIYKINNTIITQSNIKYIVYYYAEHTTNQHKFTSKISFDSGLHIESIKDVYLQCDTCNRIFRVHFNNIRLQDINNICCIRCKLANTTYPIRKYKNTNITYQSGIEKEFLDFCFNNGIKVENGKEISYQFNGKMKTYITDFYLPKIKYIIELKAKNKFYRDDLKSGKIEAKNSAANIYAKQYNLHFKFVFDYELHDFFQQLLNETDSLEN